MFQEAIDVDDVLVQRLVVVLRDEPAYEAVTADQLTVILALLDTEVVA